MKAYHESNALYYQNFNDIVKSQAEAAMLKDIHEEMFDIYVEKKKHISNTKAKSYSKIYKQVYDILTFR